jgi:hypothetical protein
VAAFCWHLCSRAEQRFDLTGSQPSIFLVRVNQERVYAHMKKIFVTSMLVPFAMICSCQKQHSTADQQLAQRKTELDARENTLDERLNALDDKVNALNKKVNALAEKEKATANAGTAASDVQGQPPNPAQAQAERERAKQQFSAQMRSMIPNDSKMKADYDKRKQPAQENLQSQRQLKLRMSSGAVFPPPEAASPSPSHAVEATSSTPSSPVESASPTSSPTP